MIKTFVFFILVNLFSHVALANNCSWGVRSLKMYTCKKETYYHGTMICGSKTFINVFCNSKNAATGESCDGDNSVETVNCREKYIERNENYAANEYRDGECFWGFVGTETFQCGEDTYYHGTARCKNGTYKNIFCNSIHAKSGANCIKDKSAETIACHNKFVNRDRPLSKLKNMAGGGAE